MFTYCLNSSTIRPAPLLDKIAIAARAGYAAIELWHDDLDRFVQSGGSLADVRKALTDHGLSVPTTIHLKDWFNTTGVDYARALEDCRRKMAQGAEVGARYVIAGPPPGSADRDLGARHYKELLDAGRELGILPAMEFLGFVDDIKTIEDGWDIVLRAGDPSGSLVLDPFHIFRGGGSIDSILKIPGDRVAICHFNDSPAHPPREQQHDKDRVYPGDGVVDLKRVVECLREIGFSGCLSLELFNETYWAQDLAEVARIGLEKMRQVVEK